MIGTTKVVLDYKTSDMTIGQISKMMKELNARNDGREYYIDGDRHAIMSREAD